MYLKFHCCGSKALGCPFQPTSQPNALESHTIQNMDDKTIEVATKLTSKTKVICIVSITHSVYNHLTLNISTLHFAENIEW